jgi:indolepyruvate ferredoxin oxidoreductase, beta subunit
MEKDSDRKRITIAILALGGQGGGVLADWILDTGSRCGYVTQGTSVPGVAQRTGATVYYIELYPRSHDDCNEPVFALMPLPGDVDIVIASELMEAGRAILRGFVSPDRTTLIASTHRIFAISEKSALSDGRASGERIIEAAKEKAKRLITFDMDEVAAQSGSIISSVMLGALAGSEALPFSSDAFQDTIRASGRAVETNLNGFSEGMRVAQGAVIDSPANRTVPAPTTPAGEALLDRVRSELPDQAQEFATEGVSRLMDYQDLQYAELYLDRLLTIKDYDSDHGGWRLTRETARYLALWMSYEDTIRVADLKIRSSRFARVRDEVRLKPDQLLKITEFMHPRLEEVCETLPAWLGHRVLASPAASKLLQPMFQKGRHVNTTSVGWFLALYTLASMRRWRRGTLRYQREQARIENWLELIRSAAQQDAASAAELIECQRLIKGYSDTFERGLSNFQRIVSAYEGVRGRPNAAAVVHRLREAALQDEHGTLLKTEIANLQVDLVTASPAAQGSLQ